MKVLLVDNYDSFTFNLFQYLGEALHKIDPAFQLDVFRNDEKSYEVLNPSSYSAIVISPGPGNPADAAYFGVCTQILREASRTVPTLGVCLGMQGLAHVYGGKVVRARVPMHGKTSMIDHDARGVFADLPQKIEVMRYHSLIVEAESIPSTFEITARVSPSGEAPLTNFQSGGSGEIMGLRHKQFPIEGIQFHPESFATEGGYKMIENFLKGTLSR